MECIIEPGVPVGEGAEVADGFSGRLLCIFLSTGGKRRGTHTAKGEKS